ncbi:EutN/CcmL family microcompartment protein [bacterium]|nr:EutN/CcmL family microcompartment protein [bacterium]
MLICRVKGNVVATRKDPRLDSWKLLICQQVGMGGEPQGEPFLSVDAAQAGVGDTALVARHGAAARAAMMAIRKSDEYAPANAVIVGIIDEITDYRNSGAAASSPDETVKTPNARPRGRPKKNDQRGKTK